MPFSGFARFQSQNTQEAFAQWPVVLCTERARELTGLEPGTRLGEVPWEVPGDLSWSDLVSEVLVSKTMMRLDRVLPDGKDPVALELQAPETGFLDLVVQSPKREDSAFRNLVEQAPVGIFVQTRGKFAYANRAACDLFGATGPDDLVGTPVVERFQPEFREQIAGRIRDLNEHRLAASQADETVLRLDGSAAIAEVSAIPFRFTGEDGALVFVEDVTERRRIAQTLRIKDELLRATGRMARVGGWEFDVESGKGTWTDEVAEIHDLAPDLVPDVALGLSFYLPESRRRIDAAIEEAIRDARPYELELEMVTASGKRKWVRTIGVPELVGDRVARMRGIFQDITEPKRAERLLAEEKERLAVTLRSIGDGVITTDTAGRVTLLNTVAESLTGWTAGEAEGKPLSEVFSIVHELTREPCEDPVAKVLKTGRVVELANHTSLISRNGREYVIADSGAPILDDSGAVVGVVLVFRDTTEKQKLADSMHRAQNLESIGVLAGGIAHDFNNLLAGIFGNLCLAQESARTGNMEETRRVLAGAMDIFERAKGLTQQLLTFSKGGTPVRKVQEIGKLVENSVHFSLSGANVSANLRIAADLWPCDCDGNQIGQVVDNLVINAMQAMPDGGVVEVVAENRMLDPGPHGPQGRRGPFVEIRVRDRGPGVPKEILSKIWAPFFSTKTTGHGLGLATVFSIVQRHDGWVDVESEPGEGATFAVWLPARPGIAGDRQSESTPVPSRGKGRILVMDDEDYIRAFIERMLESLGYEPTMVAHGQEALSAFRKAEESRRPFRACILDLTVAGGMGGKATARELLEIRPDVVLLAASGYSDDPVFAEPEAHGFHGSLAKPFLKEDLAKLLESVLPT